MPKEEQEEDIDDDEGEYESPIRDMSGVFEKVMTPKGHDAEVTRDLKLTKTNYNDRMYLVRLKALIDLCRKHSLLKAVTFYEKLYMHYVNVLASDGGFTAKNLTSSRQFIKKEIDSKGKRKLF